VGIPPHPPRSGVESRLVEEVEAVIDYISPTADFWQRSYVDGCTMSTLKLGRSTIYLFMREWDPNNAIGGSQEEIHTQKLKSLVAEVDKLHSDWQSNKVKRFPAAVKDNRTPRK
jgi:hypothetical protein